MPELKNSSLEKMLVMIKTIYCYCQHGDLCGSSVFLWACPFFRFFHGHFWLFAPTFCPFCLRPFFYTCTFLIFSCFITSRKIIFQRSKLGFTYQLVKNLKINIFLNSMGKKWFLRPVSFEISKILVYAFLFFTGKRGKY